MTTTTTLTRRRVRVVRTGHHAAGHRYWLHDADDNARTPVLAGGSRREAEAEATRRGWNVVA